MQAICKYLLAVLCLLPLFFFAGKPAGEKSFYMVREGKACGIIVWRSGNNYAAEAAKELQYAFAGTAQQTCHFLFADGHVEALSPVPLKGKRNMFTNGRVQSFYSYFVGTLRF